MIIAIALGILLAFVLLATIRFWLPVVLVLGAVGIGVALIGFAFILASMT